MEWIALHLFIWRAAFNKKNATKIHSEQEQRSVSLFRSGDLLLGHVIQYDSVIAWQAFSLYFILGKHICCNQEKENYALPLKSYVLLKHYDWWHWGVRSWFFLAFSFLLFTRTSFPVWCGILWSQEKGCHCF